MKSFQESLIRELRQIASSTYRTLLLGFLPLGAFALIALVFHKGVLQDLGV